MEPYIANSKTEYQRIQIGITKEERTDGTPKGWLWWKSMLVRFKGNYEFYWQKVAYSFLTAS